MGPRGGVGLVRILVLALGNSLKGDEGVAQAVLESLRPRIATGQDLELTGSVMGGVAMVNLMLDFERVLIIDGDATPGAVPGEVRTYTPETMEETLHASDGEGGLRRVLELGERFYPGRMPKEVRVIGIETLSMDSFVEGLSPAVAAAVPRAVEVALGILEAWAAPGAR